MIFKSHMISMVIFAAIVSVMLAFIRHSDLRHVRNYALKLFLYLAGGDIKAATYHYGTAYLASAGLLNFLVALNAFDLAKGRKP